MKCYPGTEDSHHDLRVSCVSDTLLAESSIKTAAAKDAPRCAEIFPQDFDRWGDGKNVLVVYGEGPRRQVHEGTSSACRCRDPRSKSLFGVEEDEHQSGSVEGGC